MGVDYLFGRESQIDVMSEYMQKIDFLGSRILFVDDERDLQRLFQAQFSKKFTVYTASSLEEVEELLSSEKVPFDLVISDLHLGNQDGLEVIKLIKERSPYTIRMIISAFRNFDRLVQAINEGSIYRFIVKPWNAEELEQVIQLALRSRLLEDENKTLVHDLQEIKDHLQGRNRELQNQKKQLSDLLNVLYDVQRKEDVQEKLDLVAEGIIMSRSFRRALIYLFDERMNVKALRYAGLSPGDVTKLMNRKPISYNQRNLLLQDEFKLGSSYFIPYDKNPGLTREHTVPSTVDESSLSDWHPDDILLIPLVGQSKKMVGLLSVDDPFSGKRPTAEELQILELFAHEAGLIIEQEEIKRSMQNTQQIMENQNIELKGKKMIFHSLLSLNYLTRKTIDIDLILESFKDYLIALFNADTFHLLLRDVNTAHFRVQTNYIPIIEDVALLKKLHQIKVPVEDHFVQRLMTEKRPIFVNCFEDFGLLKKFFTDLSIQSLFVAPLVYNEQVLGIMSLGFETQRNISLKLLEDYELFSNQLASIIFQEELIKQQEESQRSRYMSTIQALAKAIEKKDPYTRNHCDMVREYSLKLAQRSGLSAEQTHQLEMASILHDIGKIGISIGILRKETPLSNDEYETIKKHPEIGEEILDSLPEFEKVRAIIRHHQERFDGKGYPDGLSGDDIPVEARILAIADAFDAMTSDRPYRKALGPDEAIAELKKHSGIQWDPHFVSIFLSILDDEKDLFELSNNKHRRLMQEDKVSNRLYQSGN